MTWMVIIALSSWGATPEAVEARLNEVSAYRANRLVDAPEISAEEYRNAALGVPTDGAGGRVVQKAYGVRI